MTSNISVAQLDGHHSSKVIFMQVRILSEIPLNNPKFPLDISYPLCYYLPMKMITLPISKYIKKFGKPKSGCECMFFRISKTRGIKIFPNKKNAEFSYRNQNKAAKYEIAPKVFSKVKKCAMKDMKKHCIYAGEIMFHRNYGYFYKTEFAKGVGSWKCICADKDFLCEMMKKLNLLSGDLHKDNLGFIRGKLVCIDFGKESLS